MKINKLKNGFLYSYIHFVVEIISFFILTTFVKDNVILVGSLIFDILAFVPQGIYGYIIDEKCNINFSYLGFILMTVALLFLYIRINPLVIIILLALGNGMIHIQGAELTLRNSDGLVTPSSLFVSGGSFGLITGKLLSMYNVSVFMIILIDLTLIIPFVLLRGVKLNENSLSKFNFCNEKLNVKTIIFIATFVVMIRAFMGYGIPTTWNNTTFQTILLYSFMGIGKALGGVSVDKIGIKKTIFISTILSIPFLIFGNNVMFISLFGIMLFSMTMAVTLCIIASSIPKYPGVAFGFTTIGLMLGTLPIFIVRINNLMINVVLIIVLATVSYFLLNFVIRKE